jgi:beta-N-acetylhexosaminidase
MKPAIFGLSGPTLTADERRQFSQVDPAGYILFNHNIVDRDQLRKLTDDLRTLSGRDNTPILIDQEGGRVARLSTPIWPEFPPSAAFGPLYALAPMTAIEAVRANAEAIALTLRDVGISVNCAPVLDLAHPVAHMAIGDRSFGADAAQVASLARAMLDGLAAGGVVGVIKHMPGQGRSTVDSHIALPVVSADGVELLNDLVPFKSLADAPMAMTGHVLFKAWDPNHCVTLSTTIITEIIRGQIGFDGLLLSDDLHMEALDGSLADRASACIMAGCDVALACWARAQELDEVAAALPDMPAITSLRLERAMTLSRPDYSVDKITALIDKRDALLSYAV